MERIGPFSSYKNIFKRKQRVYKVGDIRIRPGINFEQFVSIVVFWGITFLLYGTVPVIGDFLGISGVVTLIILEATVLYYVIGKVDFRGMGLFNFLRAVIGWFRSPKVTLLDIPVDIDSEVENLSEYVYSGYYPGENEEVVSLSNLHKISISGSADITISNGFVFIRKLRKPRKKKFLKDGQKIIIDKKKKTIVKLNEANHVFIKTKENELLYSLQGESKIEQISDQSLDREYYF